MIKNVKIELKISDLMKEFSLLQCVVSEGLEYADCIQPHPPKKGVLDMTLN